jgi:hypothetical protein
MFTTTLTAGHHRVVPLPSLGLLVCMCFNFDNCREQLINFQDGVLVPCRPGVNVNDVP